jgi:uncharacterized protein YndB with AHSA1/START domain
MPEFAYRLERAVEIRATPETVFRFFTDSARWAQWWGAGSTIEGVPGGRVYIRHSNGVEVVGEVLEVRERVAIVFTYGYASGKPMGPGASRVSILLEATGAGTRLHLVHEFAESGARDLHVQGWRFQLSLFGNVVANEVFSGAEAVVDDWFEAWLTADEARRNAILEKVASPGVRFRDRYSLLQGVEDVSAHIAAALRFMPGVALRRTGAIRHCQGTMVAETMSGVNVFEFGPDGRIDSVTGLANT